MGRDLQGTVALVTGASRGLGRAFALALAEAGADLVLAARSVDDLQLAADDAAKHGVRAQAFPTDLRDGGQIDALVEGAMRAFGRIDVLVNNAGIAGAEKPALDLARPEWEEALAVNLLGPALLARAVARGMVERRHGRIINVASIAGLAPVSRLGPYCVSKAALIQLTRVLALELARHNVQVNALCPGYFRTPMNEAFFATPKGQAVVQHAIPMQRLGDPKELAPMVVFLASEASSFMTGSVVVVDGGQTLV
ncbi:MAG: SDR family oxidoreductase [Candidatus Rokubacteria bacterium]|nr:SDR family oxidoreductase [Candidatus Rokubacteria bacterium]